MLPGWDSLSAVSFWQNLCTVLSYVALALLLVFEVLAHVYDGRKESLLKLESDKKDQQVRALESQLKLEKETIRSLTATLNITFSGQWDESDPPFTDGVVMAPVSDIYFVQLIVGSGTEFFETKLYGTKNYRYFRVSPNTQVFSVDVTVKPDDRILGKSRQELKGVRGAVVTLPIIYPNKLKVPEVQVTSVLLELSINNQERITRTYPVNTTVRPSHVPENRLIQIGIPLIGNDLLREGS